MSEYVLEATGLHKSYGDLIAVNDVTIQIAKGECVAFLGPNGAGKTTTVEILEGLQQADRGDVQMFGMSLNTDKEKILEKTGVLLQETYLYKKLTVKETLQLFASFYKSPRSVDEMIKSVELEDKANTRLEKLSGGQKQRVYIACGLINNPELFFLDEPTTGLDPQARRMIWGLLEQLKKGGCSLLLTTHYMEEAEELADRVLIIDHGQIIATGSPQALVKEHCGEERILIDVAEGTAGALKQKIESALGVEATVKEAGEKRLIVETEQSVQAIGKLSHLVSEVESIQLKRATLEDVFLKLTGRSIRDA